MEDNSEYRFIVAVSCDWSINPRNVYCMMANPLYQE